MRDYPHRQREMLWSRLSEALDGGAADDFTETLRELSTLGGGRQATGLVVEALRQPWHAHHEDLVATLDSFRDPGLVDVFRWGLFAPWVAPHDGGMSIRLRCVYALRKLATPESIVALGEALGAADGRLVYEATKRLLELATSAPSDPLRMAARAQLPPERQIRASYTTERVRLYCCAEPQLADGLRSARMTAALARLLLFRTLTPSFVVAAFETSWGAGRFTPHLFAIDVQRRELDRWLLAAPRGRPFLPSDAPSLELEPIVISWEAERSIDAKRLPWSALSLRLSSDLWLRMKDWAVAVHDVTDVVRELAQDSVPSTRASGLPGEAVYPHPVRPFSM